MNWEDWRRALDYDIYQEREFSYKGISTDAMVAHITRFVSGLWQIHAFCEGNTRTTAVFTILYLRSIGFEVNNTLFARHSWYFRNALVRANYKNAIKGIDYTPVYLERFFRNLLLGEQWDLSNRYLHIHATDELKVQPKLDTPTSAPQVKPITPTSTPTSNKTISEPLSNTVRRLVLVIGQEERSVREMMEAAGLKDRKNFLEYSLTPAIAEGLIRMKYPDSPRHPRQKYLLTVKGLTVYKGISEGL